MRIIVSELLIIYLQITLEIVYILILSYWKCKKTIKYWQNILIPVKSNPLHQQMNLFSISIITDTRNYRSYFVYRVEKREIEMVFKMQSHARYICFIAFYMRFYSVFYAKDRNVLRCKDLDGRICTVKRILKEKLVAILVLYTQFDPNLIRVAIKCQDFYSFIQVCSAYV